MKNFFILTIFFSVVFLSCKKPENVKPSNSANSSNPQKQCNCGTITDDGVDFSPTCYWLEIRSECSGNKKKFCFDSDIWMKAYVGSRFCVTNQQGW